MSIEPIISAKNKAFFIESRLDLMGACLHDVIRQIGALIILFKDIFLVK